MKRLASLCALGLLAACAAGNPPPVTPEGGETVAADGKHSQIATDGDGEWGIVGDPSYVRVVNDVTNMVNDNRVTRGAQRRGLDVVNVMWEDVGRAQGSALGPNISDLTLQVRYKQGDDFASALMPVIRFPNFTDRTGDVPADKFFVRVGNENDKRLRSVPLTKVLKNVRRFVSNPRSIKGSGNLLAKRDTHFLVSAQAVFLPIPKQGKATFNPVVFNYQSAPDSPAVLTMLVTRQGTSITVIENEGEDQSGAGWGQELYFNEDGQRASFTAERKSDVEKRIESQGGPRTQDDRTALERGADVLFLIQVPLKHENRGFLGGPMDEDGAMEMAAPAAQAPPPTGGAVARGSDVEQAVLGHGPKLGPFKEGDGLKLERDPRFPIRITVQFYKATSNGVVSDRDLDGIAKAIGSVYEHADFVGSLVVPKNDPKRPTEWQSIPNEWFPW